MTKWNQFHFELTKDYVKLRFSCTLKYVSECFLMNVFFCTYTCNVRHSECCSATANITRQLRWSPKSPKFSNNFRFIHLPSNGICGFLLNLLFLTKVKSPRMWICCSHFVSIHDVASSACRKISSVYFTIADVWKRYNSAVISYVSKQNRSCMRAMSELAELSYHNCRVTVTILSYKPWIIRIWIVSTLWQTGPQLHEVRCIEYHQDSLAKPLSAFLQSFSRHSK